MDEWCRAQEEKGRTAKHTLSSGNMLILVPSGSTIHQCSSPFSPRHSFPPSLMIVFERRSCCVRNTVASVSDEGDGEWCGRTRIPLVVRDVSVESRLEELDSSFTRSSKDPAEIDDVADAAKRSWSAKR